MEKNLERVIHICICVTIHSCTAGSTQHCKSTALQILKRKDLTARTRWWHRFTPCRFLELRTVMELLPCVITAAPLRGPSSLCHQAQGALSPAPAVPSTGEKPLWLGGSKMEKPQLLLRTAVSLSIPGGWRSRVPRLLGNWLASLVHLEGWPCPLLVVLYDFPVSFCGYKERHLINGTPKLSKQRSPLPSPQTERILQTKLCSLGSKSLASVYTAWSLDLNLYFWFHSYRKQLGQIHCL